MSTSLSQFFSSLTTTVTIALGTFHIVLGTIGTLLNIVVFCRSHFWRTSCGLYLLVSYLSSLGLVLTGQLSRLIVIPPNSPLLNTFWYCQLRNYLINSFGLFTRELIVLASLDRLFLCSTNVQTRQWCEVKRARWIILLMLIVALILPLRIPLSYEYRPFSRACYSSFDWLITYDLVYQLVFVAIVPCVLLTIFSMKLIICLHLQRLRLARELRSRDKQLVRMLLAQILIYVVLHLILLASTIYNRVTFLLEKTRDRMVVENFISFLVNAQVIYFYFSLTFYVNLIISPGFRRDLIQLANRTQGNVSVLRTNTRVQPFHPTARSLSVNR